jgi:hypothetical protein
MKSNWPDGDGEFYYSISPTYSHLEQKQIANKD